MVGVSFLFYAPWMPVFLRQTGGREAVRASLPVFTWDALRWMAFGETIATGDLRIVSVLLLLLLGWTIWQLKMQAIVPAAGAIVPLLAMYAAGTTNPAYYKFMLTGVPFLCLWLAGSLRRSEDWQGMRQRAWLPAVSLVLVAALGMVFSLHNLYRNETFARDDYRSIAQRINADNLANAGIILVAPNQWEVFTYYHREGAPVYPLPKGQPDPEIVEPQLTEIAAEHDLIFALFWGDEQRDPQHVIENWLDANTFKAAEEWVGDVRFVTYKTAGEGSPSAQERLDVRFGDGIELVGMTLGEGPAKAGDIVPVTLFWRAYDVPQKRYKVFLHLLDADNQIVAQQDGEPGGGASPTTGWEKNSALVDRRGLVLPADLPHGDYRLLLGLYLWDTPTARLITVDGQDALEAGQITVK
jgi:hypothetical protein